MAGKYHVVKVFEGLYSYEVLSCYGESEVFLYEYDDVYHVEAVEFEGLHQGCIGTNLLYIYFEFVGSLYYRWGLPEEQEKFFRGNAIALRTEFMKKQGREK